MYDLIFNYLLTTIFNSSEPLYYDLMVAWSHFITIVILLLFLMVILGIAKRILYFASSYIGGGYID